MIIYEDERFTVAEIDGDIILIDRGDISKGKKKIKETKAA